MTVGIVGLGLIGGSFAKAFSDNDEHKCIGFDIDNEVMNHAYEQKIIDDELSDKNIGQCDLILVALYPNAAIDYIRKMAQHIDRKTFVIDCCGIKGEVCRQCFPIAREYGFTFVGGHPMAGRHFSGLEYSTKTMYDGASMVLVPESLEDEAVINKAKQLLSPIRFGKFTVCSADKHDAMIAFTSQMAHVVSNAYVKSPTAREHMGFSAGSYKDLTRVAWLNEDMWTELFLENKQHLLHEIDVFIKSMSEYKEAMENNDASRLRELLAYGKKCKEEIDGIN